MKICLVADIHLGQKKFNRDDEKLKILSSLFNKYSKVFILGDLFHTKNPSSSIRKRFMEICIGNKDTTIHIIGGNHDMTKEGIHPLSSESLLPTNVRLDSNTEIEGIYILHGVNIEENFKKIKIDGRKKNILLSHLLIKGSIVGSSYQLDSGLNVSDFKQFHKVFLGDVHKYQQINNVYYTGPIVRNSFNLETSGYVELDMGTFEHEFIKLPDRVQIIPINKETETCNLQIDDNSFIRFDITGTLAFYNKVKEGLKKQFNYELVEFTYQPEETQKYEIKTQKNYFNEFKNEIEKKKLTSYMQTLENENGK